MSQRHKLQAILRDAYRGAIAFRDFERLLRAYGFTLARTTGSHRQYTHPDVARPFPVQSDGKDAKRYQLREFLALIERYDLQMKDE